MTQQIPNAMLTIFDGGALSFRNRIINGAMGVAQRGTSFSTPASAAYTLDRWFVNWTGAAPTTVAQVTGPTGFRNALQITGAASNTAVNINQKIESLNCSDLSGATVTIQANIAVSVAQTVSWQLYYANAQDNFSSVTAISSGTWSATTTATTFTATVAGLPAGAMNGLYLAINPNNGGAFTSGTFTITGVQLEKGAVSTPFEFRHHGTELALCQRYYVPIGGNLTAMLNGSGTVQAFAYLPVTPRATPAVSYSGTANMVAFGIATYTSTTQPSGINCIGNNLYFTVTGFGATSASGGGQLSGPTYVASMEL